MPAPHRTAAVLLAAVLLAGCSADGRSDGGHRHGPGDTHAQLPTPAPVPTWDATAERAAAEQAHAAMTAFTDTADPDRWWGRLRPLLTPAAQQAYSYVDPAAVPASRVGVRGAAALEAVEAGSAYLATVEVPTDAGTYTVLLAREGAGSPWLVERLTPPGDAAPEDMA